MHSHCSQACARELNKVHSELSMFIPPLHCTLYRTLVLLGKLCLDHDAHAQTRLTEGRSHLYGSTVGLVTRATQCWQAFRVHLCPTTSPGPKARGAKPPGGSA